MISEGQIQDLIDSDEHYSKKYFIWHMDPSNTSTEQFYLDEIESDLDERAIALMLETGDMFSYCDRAIDAREWLVLTDEEAAARCNDCAKVYADDALAEIPKHLQEYFNESTYIEDLLDNGRGELLSTYDGVEYEQEVNRTTYYLYRR